MQRRDALRVLGGVVAAGLGAAGLAACDTRRPTTERLKPIGLQLYTVRRELRKNFERTLDRVAEIGYTEVEFAGYFGRSPEAVRSALERSGLLAPSAHVPVAALEEDWLRALDAAHRMGHRFLVVTWIPPEGRRTLDDYRRLAELFNRAGKEAQSAGIQFAYHNHEFEFARIEGAVPYDVLLEATDATLVQFELDLYWITKGGQDPHAYFDRYPGRFPLLHVKDSAGPPAHEMVDVGMGVIDFRAIFASRGQAGVTHFFVEHDRPADALASISRSYKNLRILLDVEGAV